MSIQDEFKAGFDKWAEPLVRQREAAELARQQAADHKAAWAETLESAFTQLDADKHTAD